MVEGTLFTSQPDGRVLGQMGQDGVLRLSHTFPNGDLYTGGWEQGGPKGEGTMEFAAGGSYNGQWEGGLPHGVGSYVYRNGDRYVGMWHHGTPHGSGRIEGADGKFYEGGWEAPGALALEGMDAAADGRRAGGTLAARGPARNLPHHDVEPLARRACYHGDGRLKTSGGETYEGGWVHGVRHGIGRASHPAGESYEGEWVDDVRCGRGKATLASGETWDGAWFADLPHGEGVLRTMAGDVYEGGMVDGRKRGHGVLTFASGVSYIGQFDADARHGTGRLYAPPPPSNASETSDESAAPALLYTGGWHEGARCGRGEGRTPAGDWWEGEWAADVPHGEGTLKFASGDVYLGHVRLRPQPSRRSGHQAATSQTRARNARPRIAALPLPPRRLRAR